MPYQSQCNDVIHAMSKIGMRLKHSFSQRMRPRDLTDYIQITADFFLRLSLRDQSQKKETRPIEKVFLKASVTVG